MRIAVTGASGFVGSAICRAAVDGGWRVHGFGRRDVRLPGVAYRRWDLAHGSLAEPPEVDVVVHTAATVTDWSQGDSGPSDVDQLGRVLATFPAARLVHISTASVYDPYRPTIAAVESQAPVTRYSTAYAEQKAAAERLLAGRPATVILRPRAIYGAGDRTVLPRLLAAMRGGALWLPGGGAVRQSLTSIENMVTATMAACVAPATGVFNVTDAEPVMLVDALEEVLARRGERARIRSVPVDAAMALAAVLEAAYRLRRSPTPPRLTRYAVSQVAVERTLDITAARSVLGYRPAPTSFVGVERW
jgi:nucleoside-diphosphate-sugar epimerase